MKISLANSSTRPGLRRMAASIFVVIVLAFGQALFLPAVHASPNFAVPLCGSGSAPDYGFKYSLQQAHWTVDWENYVSEQSVTEVDVILDQLNAESIAQTMILFQSAEQVGTRVNCAVHFLRYMQLGLVTGERQDNGFVFLIVVEPDGIDVHYGAGLGLPALTAPELTALSRAAEATYQSTQSMDQALLTLVQDFAAVARNQYAPLIAPTQVSEMIDLPQLPTGPLGIVATCGFLCLGLLLLPFLLWLLTQMSKMGIRIGPSGFGSGGFGGSFGRGGSGPSSRGGSGSGRSGRGN